MITVSHTKAIRLILKPVQIILQLQKGKQKRGIPFKKNKTANEIPVAYRIV